MTINQQIDALKSEHRFREAGILAAANNQDRRYGCHFGFTSTLHAAKEAFLAGFDHYQTTYSTAQRLAGIASALKGSTK
tara:strand:+ start:149 stop:385 length:237 start_codon:yes stop_codon:yes gene_type:complete